MLRLLAEFILGIGDVLFVEMCLFCWRRAKVTGSEAEGLLEGQWIAGLEVALLALG